LTALWGISIQAGSMLSSDRWKKQKKSEFLLESAPTDKHTI